MTITTHRPTQTSHQPRTHTIDKEVTAMETFDLFALLDAVERTEIVPCREHDAEIWFAQTPDDVEFAKALCGTCPVVEECLTHAVETGAMWGIWGGQLFEWGVLVPKKRPAAARARRPWLPRRRPTLPHLHCPRHPPPRAGAGCPDPPTIHERGGTMSSHEVCARLRAYRERRRREFERRLEQHREHVLLVEQVRLHVR